MFSSSIYALSETSYFFTCSTIVLLEAKQNSCFPGTGLPVEVKRTVSTTLYCEENVFENIFFLENSPVQPLLLIPFFGRFMCPLAAAGLGFKYLVTRSSERLRHPFKNHQGRPTTGVWWYGCLPHHLLGRSTVSFDFY